VFLLASIATMIASAATVPTHHNHQNSSTGNTKGLCIEVMKRFFVLNVLRIICILAENSLLSMSTSLYSLRLRQTIQSIATNGFRMINGWKYSGTMNFG
jgi:hypothetical protein